MDDKTARRKRRRSLRLLQQPSVNSLAQLEDDIITEPSAIIYQADDDIPNVSTTLDSVCLDNNDYRVVSDTGDLGSAWVVESPEQKVTKKRGRRSNIIDANTLSHNVGSPLNFSDIEQHRAPDNPEIGDSIPRSETPVLFDVGNQSTPDVSTPVSKCTARQIKSTEKNSGSLQQKEGKSMFTDNTSSDYDLSSMPYSPSQPVFDCVSPFKNSPMANKVPSVYNTPISGVIDLEFENMNDKFFDCVDIVEEKVETSDDKKLKIRRKTKQQAKDRSVRKSNRKVKPKTEELENSGKTLGFLSICKSLAGKLANIVRPSPEPSPSCSSVTSTESISSESVLSPECTQSVSDVNDNNSCQDSKNVEISSMLDSVFTAEEICQLDEFRGGDNVKSEMGCLVKDCEQQEDLLTKTERVVMEESLEKIDIVCKDGSEFDKNGDKLVEVNDGAGIDTNVDGVVMKDSKNNECSQEDRNFTETFNVGNSNVVDFKKKNDDILNNLTEGKCDESDASKQEKERLFSELDEYLCEKENVITASAKMKIKKKREKTAVKEEMGTEQEKERIFEELDEYIGEKEEKVDTKSRNKRKRRQSSDFYICDSVPEEQCEVLENDSSSSASTSRRSTRLRRKSFEIYKSSLTNSSEEQIQGSPVTENNEDGHVSSPRTETANNVQNDKEISKTIRMCRKRKNGEKGFSLEEIYRNKSYKAPEEKKWETIFESPLKSKNPEVIQSKCRYKRAVTFEVVPPVRIKKRIQKAAKLGWDNRKRKKIALPDEFVINKLAEVDELLSTS